MHDALEIGVFAAPEGGGDPRPLHLEKRTLESGETEIEIVVDEEPWEAGVDPNVLFVDRDPDDNRRRVELR